MARIVPHTVLVMAVAAVIWQPPFEPRPFEPSLGLAVLAGAPALPASGALGPPAGPEPVGANSPPPLHAPNAKSEFGGTHCFVQAASTGARLASAGIAGPPGPQ
jgi:hypothetical protein